jgi:hypothetical protein
MGEEVGMEPVTLVLVPGILGGIVIALFVFRLQGPRAGVDPLRNHPPTTDVINMARIRVDGVGGLGLVAMALTVAWFVPRIRQHVLLGLALGVLFAIVLVALRRRRGPMSSSGDAPGANTTLTIDEAPPARESRSGDVPGARVEGVRV